MIAQQLAALGYEQIADLSASVGLTVPTGANIAVIVAETADVRWRDDGVAPTDAIGMPLSSSGPALEYSGPLANIQFIAASGSPVLNVSYYRIAG
ncbi:MAG TPA: hypothetical protein VGC14_02625 [Rhizobium sp.]